MAGNSKLTSLELNGVKYALGKSIYAELDMSLERFVELLGRDLYCPTLSAAPTTANVSYTDTDGESHSFQVGQPCRWKENGAWRLAVCTDNTGSASSWYILPVKVSELTNDSGYISKSAADNAYLGKTAKAASASTADSATKATNDSSGNKIVDTYATKGTAISGITRNGKTFTATRADGTTFTFTQQDTDTTYSSKAAASGGTDVSLVTTGEKYTWNSKASTAVASTSANGLMSSSDKTKLNGIASGAEVNVQSDWNVTDTSSDAYIKNKPTIPSAVTESTVSGWGFTKNAGTYSKPSTGIPKSDLASAVQTSLGKADTALQSYTEQYTGTVTGVKMNGSTKNPSSGVVDLGTVITSHQDISGKLDATTAASTYLTKTDASNTYLGKSAKAASASTADSATKATNDSSGNKIVDTYATKSALSGLQTQVDTLVSGDASTAIESFNEIVAFLAGVSDTGTLDGIVAGINTEIAKKASKADSIKNITRSGNTFTATRADGTTFTFTQADNNTTYTFAGGTNKFTVTPSNGTAQEVTVTPSISNNVTYSGTLTSGQVAVYDGTAGTVKSSGYTIAKSVPSSAVFTDTVPSAYCSTAAGTAAKTAVCTGYALTANTYIHLVVANANSSTGALTLNINSKGAKSIYINGSASSSSNYTLPAGSYIVFYDGTQYQLRTDGIIPGKIMSAKSADSATSATSATKATQDASGNTITSTYLTKTDAASTYLGKSAKAASATTADSATKATNDSSGNKIVDTYATKGAAISSITRNGKTFTATRADGTTFTFTQQDTDTTYSSKAAASGGTDVSLVTTGEKYTWNSKASTAVASTSANGLMSSSDKTKLNGIASGAEVNVQSDWNVTDTSSDAYIKNKPTIPSAVTESTVSGWGFTKNTGTVTGIKMNGSTKNPSSGVVDLGTVITSHQDISGKLDATTAASTYLTKTDAASTYLGKSAKATSASTADSATKATSDGSGNNIVNTYATKTSVNAKQDKVDIVDHGTDDTTFELTPNVLHKWGSVSNLTLTLAAPVDTTVANYYMFEFTSGSTATTLSLPSTVTWASDVSIEANKTYQVSILNGCGIIGGF